MEGQRVRVRSALAGHIELEVEQAPALRPCTVAAAVVRVRRRGNQADQVVHLVRVRVRVRVSNPYPDPNPNPNQGEHAYQVVHLVRVRVRVRARVG